MAGQIAQLLRLSLFTGVVLAYPSVMIVRGRVRLCDRWQIEFYNHKQSHSALSGQTTAVI